jgi:hypothetical protein
MTTPDYTALCDRLMSMYDDIDPRLIDPCFREAATALLDLQAKLAEAERDARRYRWLRDADLEVLEPMLETYGGVGFDEKVDAALATGSAPGSPPPSITMTYSRDFIVSDEDFHDWLKLRSDLGAQGGEPGGVPLASGVVGGKSRIRACRSGGDSGATSNCGLTWSRGHGTGTGAVCAQPPSQISTIGNAIVENLLQRIDPLLVGLLLGVFLGLVLGRHLGH